MSREAKSSCSHKCHGAALALILAMLLTHAVMSVTIATRYSPNPDEMAHVCGGLVIWQHKRFDVYCVNPPLTRLIASVPALITGTNSGWISATYEIEDRPEFDFAQQFMAAHPDTWKSFLWYGRIALLPFTILGGLLCFSWARRLYGLWSGIVALTLWCFSPMILTWGSVIGSDGPATTLSLLAALAFSKWLREPGWRTCLLAGLALGLSQLAKFTLLIFFPLWAIVWIAHTFRQRKKLPALQQTVQFAILLTLAVYVINTGYAYTGTLQQLSQYQFSSEVLSGNAQADSGDDSNTNKFRGSLFGHLPVPLPKDFVLGIDLQKKDFEEGKLSYLAGTWQDHGWWYYYAVCAACKIPVGTLLLFLFAAGFAGFRLSRRVVDTSESEVSDGGGRASETLSHDSVTQSTDNHPDHLLADSHPATTGADGCWPDRVLLVTVPICIIALASSQTGFSVHFRYLLPAFPFVFVWVSQLASQKRRLRRGHSLVVTCCLAGTVVSSVHSFPHSMSYFNEFSGGPGRGYRFILGSSFSWGQNCIYVNDWIHRQGIDETPFINLESPIPADMRSTTSRGPSPTFGPETSGADSLSGPVPGLHLVEIEAILNPDRGLAYFAEFEAFDVIADTIAAFRLERDQVDTVRSRLNMPPLRSPPSKLEQFSERIGRSDRVADALTIAVFSTDECGPDNCTVPADFGRILPDAEWILIDTAAILNGALERCDVLVVPGGKSSVQSDALGPEGREAIVRFVDNGGGYVGVCAGAFLGSSSFPWSLNLINVECLSGSHYVPKLGYQSWIDRGAGDVRISVSPELMMVLSEESTPREDVLFAGGPVFYRGRRTYLGEFLVLARYDSEVFRYPFQQNTMTGTPAIIAAPYGDGKAFLLGAHFEMSDEFRQLCQKILLAAGQ